MSHISRAYNQMEKLKLESLVDDSLDLHFKEIECNRISTIKRAEYDELYPYCEDKVVGEDKETLIPIVKCVPIEYELCEWIEPIPPVIEYDEDGNEVVVRPEIPGYYTPNECTPTYEQWLNGWVCPEYDTTVDLEVFKATDDEYRTYYKRVRQIAVSNIVVEVDGIRFDGDEVSQTRMVRAIQSLVGDEEVPWIDADNNTIMVTQTTLGKALRLAGEEQTRLW